MSREIKFRALLDGVWYYSDSNKSAKALGCKLGGSIAAAFWERFYVGYKSLSEYTGLKDKNGKEIYEGDVVRWFQLGIEYQTHYGDNIPLGSYTEPCGIKSECIIKPIKFKDQCFTTYDGDDVDENGYREYIFPFGFEEKYDRNSLNQIFYPRPHGRESEALNDEDFLESAVEIANDLSFRIDSIDHFISEINSIEVIGNIYENPELLK